jgi:predicted Zn-dependent protease
MNIFRTSPYVILLLLGTIAQISFAAEKSLLEMEREAKEILSKGDNVAERKTIGPVFSYAERCAVEGKTAEAIKYYEAGLERYPWNLNAQLAMARMLIQAGNTNGARQKAELTLKYAETDVLLASAAALLGRSAITNLEDSVFSTNGIRLVLVPYGKVEAWLLHEMQEGLEMILSIPVSIKLVPSLEMPKPGREPLHQYAEDLRVRISKSRKDPQFDRLYRRLNLSTNSFKDDEEVFATTEAVLAADFINQGPVQSFRNELALLRRLGSQWEAQDLINQLSLKLKPNPGSDVAYLGITGVDIFSSESRFVFGYAMVGANVGVVSYLRYSAALLDEPPNRERLKERTLKQALSSTGLMFGLPRCSDPTCARAYAHSLSEHDAKQLKLCEQCKEGFQTRFGKQK